MKTVENYINVTAPVTPTATPTPTSTVTPTPTGSLPVANFTVTPRVVPARCGILVTDTSVNATSVRYDLGDGTTTAYPNFRYTYWQAGTYTIRQTATNAAGSSNKTDLGDRAGEWLACTVNVGTAGHTPFFSGFVFREGRGPLPPEPLSLSLPLPMALSGPASSIGTGADMSERQAIDS